MCQMTLSTNAEFKREKEINYWGELEGKSFVLRVFWLLELNNPT